MNIKSRDSERGMGLLKKEPVSQPSQNVCPVHPLYPAYALPLGCRHSWEVQGCLCCCPGSTGAEQQDGVCQMCMHWGDGCPGGVLLYLSRRAQVWRRGRP